MAIHAGFLIAAALLLSACELKEDSPPPDRADRNAGARRDTSGASPSTGPAAAPPPDSLAGFDTLFITRVDTILVPRGSRPARAVPGTAAVAAGGTTSFDSGLVTTPAPASASAGASAQPGATASDIAALRMGIVIPVRGVAAASLRDTYTESRGTRAHDAIDILAPRGTPVVSAAAGRVVQLHDSKPGGLMVYAADASDRFILLYGHLDSYAPGLRVGMPLVAGQQIGAVGTTGNAPPGTPHLHFAILRGKPSQKWWSGTPINPYPLLRP